MSRITCRCHEWIPPRVLAACRRVRARDCCAYCLTEFFRSRKVEESKPVRFYSIEEAERLKEAA